MKTIKYIRCACGEDIYEDDRGPDTPEGSLECDNCHKFYPEENLIEEEVMKIISQGPIDVIVEDLIDDL